MTVDPILGGRACCAPLDPPLVRASSAEENDTKIIECGLVHKNTIIMIATPDTITRPSVPKFQAKFENDCV